MIALDRHVPEAELSRLRSQRGRRSGSDCIPGVVEIPVGEVAPPGLVYAASVPMLQVYVGPRKRYPPLLYVLDAHVECVLSCLRHELQGSVLA